MAMTPLQSVLWDVKQRIENDKKLSKLRQKVNSGKATYADTAAYSTHVGNLLGDTFAQHILSVSPELREALTVELLHDRYMDINAIIDRVQKSMDEAQGLHLAPQHSPFYDDRAHQIGSALADPTVPDETIKRRARAATATATKSMHDDRMKTEAKFRSRAGLNCTVNRVAAAKCCEWCDQVAGKYAYEDTPPDLWRRHDNCNCTIVYGTRRDRQVLRGTEKKWEIVAEGAGAPEPVRLTPEQARKLQEKHQLKRLTKSAESGTMESREPIRISMQFFGQPNFSNQTTAGIRKSIRSLRKRISEHLREIEDADSMYSELGQLSSIEQAGSIKHWRKEIERFKRQIEQAEEELRKRGEKV